MPKNTGANAPMYTHAYLPRWGDDEELPRLSDPLLAPKHGKAGPPPPPSLPIEYPLPTNKIRIWKRLKLAFYVVVITLLRHYDLGCNNPMDQAQGNIQRLLNELYFEETFEIADYIQETGDTAYDFQLTPKTIQRLSSKSHRFPVYNRLFDALRVLGLSVPLWCVLRDVYIDGRVPGQPQFKLPLPGQYDQDAKEYADAFYSEEEMEFGKRDMLRDLASYAHWMMYSVAASERLSREQSAAAARKAREQEKGPEQDEPPKLDTLDVDFSKFIQARYLKDGKDHGTKSEKKGNAPGGEVRVVQQTLNLNANPTSTSSVQQNVNATATIPNPGSSNATRPSTTVGPSNAAGPSSGPPTAQQTGTTASQSTNPPVEGNHNTLVEGRLNSLTTGTDNTLVGGSDNALAQGTVNSLVQGAVTPSTAQSLNFIFHQTFNMPASQQTDFSSSFSQDIIDRPVQNLNRPMQNPLNDYLRGLSDDQLWDILAQVGKTRRDSSGH
ncbi:hypothetical protein TWF102_010394 [Orbilia oligospora]|uniref:Uncharacterized protein n=1 Tax=Orbilia oligospora TaxID=2813651 RepID=A0A7C8N627_ORBOL|nr:hypothetical protein TWF102_010394 [Orbilia oligospora]